MIDLETVQRFLVVNSSLYLFNCFWYFRGFLLWIVVDGCWIDIDISGFGWVLNHFFRGNLSGMQNYIRILVGYIFTQKMGKIFNFNSLLIFFLLLHNFPKNIYQSHRKKQSLVLRMQYKISQYPYKFHLSIRFVTHTFL